MNTTKPDRIGLGTAALGGLFDAIDEAAARATVDRAWELGVRYFDTAPLYGSGLAEQRTGAALRERPRDEFVLSTKVGRLLRPGRPDPMFKGAPPLAPVFDFSADAIRCSLEESLERLQLDRVDIGLIHDPDEHLEAGLLAVSALRNLVSTIGVGTNRVETAIAFVRGAEIDCVLIAGRYTLLDSSAQDVLLPLCLDRGVRVIAGGVFNSGLLSGGGHYDYHAPPAEMMAKTAALAAVCAGYDIPLAAAAIQFPLRHPAVTSLIVGARTADEVQADLELLALPIPEEFWSDPGIPQVAAS